MKLKQQVTSLKLSKRLKALGAKQESVFAWTENFPNGYKLGTWEENGNAEDRYIVHQYAAYIVAELWEILPSRLFNSAGGEHSTHQLVCEKFPDGRANASYVCIKCKGNLVQIQETANLSEELGKLLEYLITNKLMSV